MAAAQKTELKKRPRVRKVLPTQCLSCDSELGYQAVIKSRPVEFRGETLHVSYEALECAACGHAVMSDEQMDARVNRTVATYQALHDMLTAKELAERRKALGFRSQQELADAAPMIALPTLKRIEAGKHAQDLTTDYILRQALKKLEEQQRQQEMLALLRKPLPGPLELDNSDVYAVGHEVFTQRGAWFVALPLAACVTFVASTNHVTLPDVSGTTILERELLC